MGCLKQPLFYAQNLLTTVTTDCPLVINDLIPEEENDFYFHSLNIHDRLKKLLHKDKWEYIDVGEVLDFFPCVNQKKILHYCSQKITELIAADTHSFISLKQRLLQRNFDFGEDNWREWECQLLCQSLIDSGKANDFMFEHFLKRMPTASPFWRQEIWNSLITKNSFTAPPNLIALINDYVCANRTPPFEEENINQLFTWLGETAHPAVHAVEYRWIKNLVLKNEIPFELFSYPYSPVTRSNNVINVPISAYYNRAKPIFDLLTLKKEKPYDPRVYI